MVIARYPGDRPSRAFLQRVRRGEIGGVILFADNVKRGRRATRRVVAEIQDAARRGGNPPLLIAIDQEGGDVRRIADGPPRRNASEYTSAAQAQNAGRATGALLRQWGVNLNLAPVADVPISATSWLGMRVFGRSPEVVTARACAFADGLHAGGVAATLKHFPGLGGAPENTDLAPTRVELPASEIRKGYAPYEGCARSPSTLVMVSSAVYPQLTGPAPAVLSRATYSRELPRVASGAVTISDDLETPAIASQTTPARRAINAGLALLLYARTEQGSASAYPRLLADAKAGRIKVRRVRAAAAKIAALKRHIAGRPQ